MNVKKSAGILAATVVISCSAKAGERTLTGTIVGQIQTYNLRANNAQGEPIETDVGVQYAVPRWDGYDEHGTWVGWDRLQRVDVQTQAFLFTNGDFENVSATPLWWAVDHGARAWYSIGSPAGGPTPHGAAEFGGGIQAYLYGASTTPAFDGVHDFDGSSGGWWGGAGPVAIVESWYVDARHERVMRALCGNGIVPVTLNLRSHFEHIESSHWSFRARTYIIPQEIPYQPQPATMIRVTYTWADPGQQVYTHEVTPWQEVGTLWSPMMATQQPMTGTGVANYDGTLFPPVWTTWPQIMPGAASVTLETSSRSLVCFGVENVDPLPQFCSGWGVHYVDCGAPFYSNGIGYNFGVGSSQQDLGAFDGVIDYRGGSGIDRFAAQGGSSYHQMDTLSAPWQIAPLEAGPTDCYWRLRSCSAAFVPEFLDAPISWWMRSGIHVRARLVVRKTLP
jgi:hypothetical protein